MTTDMTDEKLARVYFEYAKTMNEVIRESRLQKADLEVLLIVGSLGGFPSNKDKTEISFTKIARELVDLSAPSRISCALTRLKEAGLANKRISKNDRRIPEVSLSEEGEKVYRDIISTYRKHLDHTNVLRGLVDKPVDYQI